MKTGYKAAKEKAKDVISVKGYAMGDMNPRMSLDSSLLPEIKDWKVGKTYTVTLEIKQTGLHEQFDSDKLCADFEILNAKESK